MSFSSNSVIAKARSIFGRSLKAEDYAQLCSKSTVAEAAAFLKQTERYNRVLSAINPQNIHRGQLETLLDRSIFDVFERFHKFDHSDSRVFFRYIIMELEAQQVLSAIECVAAGAAERYISELPVFLTQHARTDLFALGRARSFLDIAELLGNTEFGKLLRPLLIDATENGSIDLRECERRVYTHYYLRSIKTVDKIYSGKGGAELKRALLKSVDMENVVTCFRMRAFGMSPEKVKASLIPFRYRLNDEALDRLMQLSDISKVESELAAIGYRTDDAVELSAVEQLAERISMDHLKRLIRMSRNSAAVYYALIECLRIEIRNVKTAVEGIRYGIPAGEILEMLVI